MTIVMANNDKMFLVISSQNDWKFIYLFLPDSSSVRVQVVPQVHWVDGRTSSLVECRLLANPEVDFPVQRSCRVHKGMKNDVAVALVELAMAVILDLKLQDVWTSSFIAAFQH